ncbi:MAG TPA: dihydroxyacetone kinase subunit DhaK [Planctomycetota bacterium]|jgi:dihydroxyacetone kinase-like protein
MAAKFHHFGVPTATKQEGETYLEGGKVYITDPEKHPYRVEFVRCEPDSPMPDVIKTKPHAAYVVSSIEEAMKGKPVVLQPFDATPTCRVAFIMDGDSLIELMQLKEEKSGMKKFVNNPENLVSELLQGFAIANAGKIKVVKDGIVCRAKAKSKSKVAVVTLGGSGHEPALSGMVGQGLLDISVAGGIFAAPGAPKVLEALKMMKRDAGILLVVLNHSGDVLCANMVKPMAEAEGIKITQVLTHEEIDVIKGEKSEEGRGLAGCLFVYKIAGAAAEAGKPLEEVARIAEKINANMATVAIASNGCTHPSTGQVIAEIGPEDYVIGMGQHGEAGGITEKNITADRAADIMLNKLMQALSIKEGEKVLLMVNGVGSTTLMEQYCVVNACKKILDAKKVTLARTLVGEYLTVQEMGGFQMCLARMDDELLEMWDASCNSPALTVK